MCATEKKIKVLPLIALFLLPKLVGHHYENSFAKVKKRRKKVVKISMKLHVQ